jgi:hypothetical protein
MPLKRQIAIPLIFFLLLILIAAGHLFLTSYILPDFLESKIISILKKDAAITDLALDFHELDLDGANLGSLRFGASQNPALIIHSIHIDYSPAGIYQKKIKKISANGVELYAEFKNGRFGFRGFDVEKFLTQLDSAGTKKEVSDDHQFPYFPQRIEINNGTLICILNEKTYRIPFEMNLVREENTSHNLKASVRLYPRGQPVHFSAQIDLEQNRIASQFAAKELDLLRFADIFRPVNGLRFAGLASLEANADMQLTPFTVSSISGRLKGSAINVIYKNIEFQNRSAEPDNATPLIIDFEGSAQGKWNIKLSEFKTVAPIAARVSDLAATVQPSQGGYKVSGNFIVSLETSAGSTKSSVPLRFVEPFNLPARFTGVFTDIGKWQFDLTGRSGRNPAAKGASFNYDQIRFTTKFPSVRLNASGIEGRISTAYKLRVPDVQIRSEAVNIFVPEIVVKGKTNLTGKEPKDPISLIDLDLSGMAMTLNSAKITLGNLSVGGKLQENKKGANGITATVQFANTNVEAARGAIILKQAQGIIPLRFPAEKSGKKGRVSIARVRYQKLNLGVINAEVQQTANGLSFSGGLKNHLIPELSTKFLGESKLADPKDFETTAQFELFYPQTGPEIDLGKFLPAAAGFTFKGKLLEKGDVVIGKEGLRATVQSSLNNASLRHRQNKITVEGIQMALFIPDLIKMRSAPGQKLEFARASMGDITIKNGEIDFQIESPRSVLVEKSHFNWCDGKVDAPAIRLTSGRQDYSLILYCDRLNLAKVLEQFGAASVEAQGELNGKIPIRYRQGQLSFQDGFLFTTPGETGKIRMTDTEILTAGIPEGTPQYVQMELARKALEDYDYAWAKLNLTTEGDDLLLNMQLDGKPAKSLPFVYRKDMGGFAKVEAGVQGSTFQGIRLDVNFRLPLNKIMQYKELIQMIQKSRE